VNRSTAFLGAGEIGHRILVDLRQVGLARLTPAKA
jgi:hypothetical protein